MKLKEIDRTAMQAWSPAQHHPIYLATGTSAQQLDATFSTNASLEIFELDLADQSLDMKSCATFSSSHRYHKLIWGPHRMESDENISGVLVAGGENGNVILYDPAKIIAGDSEVVIAQQDKHTGPVRALDINGFQTNLVASGANESEIYIWDLNNFAVPMTPGAKSQPLEDISCIAWNRQVQHILASTSPSGRATVWDLRKNEPILKVSDHSNRMHCSGMAWHPDVATQMVLSSEDDRLPVIQMWDLRFASSPLRVMEMHTRGILAIAWSMADPELLLSCGKDSRILCSNPNTGEILYELPTNTQWCFDIQWCPRNPAVLSAASFDGRISIYSIMGGGNDNLSQKQADQLSSSFGNLDPFGTGHPLPPLQLPQQPTQQSTVIPLKKPPKWLRRPVGASFSFGGKLVTFEALKSQSAQPQHPQAVQQHYQVYISQVVTEQEFLSRSNQLQDVVSTGAFADYCQKKIEEAKTDFDKNVWSFLKVNFENDSRGKYLELLGFRKEDLREKIASVLSNTNAGDKEPEVLKETDQASESDEEGNQAAEDLFLGEQPSNLDKAVNVRPVDKGEKLSISVSGDVDGLITQALLTGNFESAVELCLHDNRMADAIILAIAGGPDLLDKTQRKYFAKTQSKITRLITAVVTNNWNEIVQSCALNNWREALAAVLTYAKPDEFASLCDRLGSRLENEGDVLLQAQACLCYICAGNVEKLVACWTKAQDGASSLSLQDLIEKVVILRKAVQNTQAVETADVGALLAEKMSQYANLLAAQGSLAAAMAFLPTSTNQINIVQLRDRLRRAQGEENMVPTAGVTTSVGSRTVPQHLPTRMMPGSDTQYYPQARIAPTVTSWSNKTPTALSSFETAASSIDTQRDGAPPPGFNIPGTVYPCAPNNTAPPPVSGNPAYNINSQMGPRQPYPQRPQNGWNDPPALSRASKKKVLENYVPPPPITAPIMNPLADPRSQQQPNPVSGAPVASVPFQPSPLPTVQPGTQNPFPNMQQHIGQPGVPLDSSKPSMEGAPGAPIGNAIQAMHTLPAEKITKNPIPEEHLILKSTFEALIQRCLSSATDPQTKRKLDDANKRLESLYDKLREQTLSPAIITGLHNIARSIELRNYMEGLNIHTHIVSTSNFSETSAFMPVLKVVLTQANKLGV
ncbi:protein transport protein Sec31A isoform X8 [Bombina bombina]|uniref:protein transport protein Sec31A isoform X8 n=1 Tax=Bombina bombina TaxID=8345 RepID=UPI00235ABE92|nr:protein transport protein Sec31A isoform X8 [Bombina bombina]